jgi:hypothetical protein
LFGLAYQLLQFQAEEAGPAREEKAEADMAKARTPDLGDFTMSMGRTFHYATLKSVYDRMRDILGFYYELEASSRTAGDTQIVQELLLAVGRQTGSLVYWNSTVYSTGTGSPIMAWPLTNGVLATTPAVQTGNQAGGHSPVMHVKRNCQRNSVANQRCRFERL